MNLKEAGKRTKSEVARTAKIIAIAAAETGSAKKSAINAWKSSSEVTMNLKEAWKRKKEVMMNLKEAGKRTKSEVARTAKIIAIAAAETGSAKKSAINAWKSSSEVTMNL